MKLKFFAAAAAFVLSAAAPVAHAAVMVTTQLPDYSEMLFNTGISTAKDTMPTNSKPGNFVVNWDSQTSTKLVQSGGGSGHAWIAGDGDAAIQDVLVLPVADPSDGHPDLLGFTKFGVTISFLNPKISVPDPKSKDGFKDEVAASENFQVRFTFSSASPLTITIPGPLLSSADFPSSGKFNFISDPGAEGYFTSIEFLNANYFSDKDQGGTEAANLGFANFKQPSFEAVVGGAGVPEPTTWTMMLLGFGGLGAMLRRRRMVA
jgi:hypothetical protein